MTSIEARTGVDLATADRFSIATPGDWFVLPLDPRTRDRRIAGLVQQRMGKGDEVAHLRRQATVHLRKVAADAERAGGFFTAMHGRMAAGRPMAASVLASLSPLPNDPAGNALADPEAVEATLSAETERDTVLAHAVVDLPIGRAAWVRRRAHSGVHGVDGREVISQNLQFYVPYADLNKMLSLAFSTPILPLADAYIELFNAMAHTAKWVQAPQEEVPNP